MPNWRREIHYYGDWFKEKFDGNLSIIIAIIEGSIVKESLFIRSVYQESGITAEFKVQFTI